MTPGKSTYEDVQAILKQGKTDLVCSSYDDGPFLGFQCNALNIWFDRSSNLVLQLSFYSDRRTTIQMIVDKYGDPDIVVIDDSMGVPEHPWTDRVIYYSSYGMVFVLDNPKTVLDYQIKPDLQITRFSYLEPRSHDNWITSLQNESPYYAIITDWHGFVDYQKYRP
jgi:hypothetical protein